MIRRYVWGIVLVMASCSALADDESRQDAWWTGPMLAASAATLPQGHALIEPYLFDIVSNATFDSSANRHSGPYEHDLGSLTYVLYGVTDRITAGLIPRFLYQEPAGAPNSSGVMVGDLTLQAGYGLTQFQDGHRTPTLSVVIQETLPTGRYDNLSRSADGVGAGAYTTALALYSQDYFWMPNGRILRARLDLTYTISSSVGVHNLSVYGTSNGFNGRAMPGNTFSADAAGEYSLTRNWVLALDLVYLYSDSTSVNGSVPGTAPLLPGTPVPTPAGYASVSGASWSLGFAPAIEYNFSSAVGVLLGVRCIELGRNTSASVTPAIAVNMVF
jgi:Putative MetA-pathway of phenol degradation